MKENDNFAMTVIDLSNKNINNIDNIIGVVNDPSMVKQMLLNDNKINMLPNDLSLFCNVEYINLENNPLSDFAHLSSILSTLPLLKELSLSIQTSEEAIILLNSLPKLEILNGKKTHDDNISKSPLQSFREELIIINHFIQRLFISFKDSKEKMEAFYLDFESLIKQQIDIINRTTPKYIHETNILKAEIIFYNYIQDVIMTILLHEKSDKDLIGLLLEINNKIRELQSTICDKLMQTQQESIELLQNGSNYIMELQKELKQFKIANKTIDSENKLLNQAISNVKRENNQMTSKIFSIANELTYSSRLTPTETIEQQAKDSQELFYKSSKSFNNQKSNNKSNGNSNSYGHKKTTLNSSARKIKIAPSAKTITENQLLDIIDSIYKSKVNSDKANNDSHLPIETLEQHMYTYLNHKYGLKKLIIENATSIINAIRQYSIRNSSICLFGKVLRNELDEGSITIMRELQTGMSQMLNKLIKEHNSTFNKEQLNQCYLSFKNNTKPLNKEMIDMIVCALFSKDNQGKETLINKIQSILTKRNINALCYLELFNIVLNHHIRTRSTYLSNIALAFRKVDIDSNGIITQDELSMLLSQFLEQTLNKDQIQQLIENLDQYDSNQITFSQVVSYLQKTQISPQASCSLLDKISSNQILTNVN